MRISLALLADHATAHQDGKLYVLGGGIKSLSFPHFPAVQPALALAIGVELDPEDLGRDHTIRIEAEGPPREVFFKPVSATFRVKATEDRRETDYFHFVSNMDRVSFPVEGGYAFVISIDGQELQRVPLRAEPMLKPETGRDADVEKALLDEGYLAFLAQDTTRAEELFRTVIERFPNDARGHNNLGFVLLGKGDASGALEEFARANELEFPQPEISDANIGAASYLAGDPAAALQGFMTCIRARILRTIATLYGIGPSGLFPVEVRSAAEYAGLMTLNAAWSAHAAGQDPAAEHYLGAARTSELLLRSDETGRLFTESVAALVADQAQRSRQRPALPRDHQPGARAR